MVCDFCGKPIFGRYIQFNKRNYHEHCYKNHILIRCSYCNNEITGDYLVDYWGSVFCKKHQNEFPACVFCGRLVPSRQNIHSIQGVRCSVCSRTAIERADQARPIFAKLVQWFHHEGLACNNTQLQIELTDRSQLTDLRGGAFNNHTLGLTLERVSVADGTRQRVDKMLILSGMPATLFEGVASHELGHVWLATQVKAQLPAWAEEGFCELIAYRRYLTINTKESLFYCSQIVNNPDPVYGDGFRRVYALEQQLGFAQLIAQLRQTRRIPGC